MSWTKLVIWNIIWFALGSLLFIFFAVQTTCLDTQKEKSLKGLFSPKMKMIPYFTHPQAILGIYDSLLLAKHNRSYIKKNIQALPSFIMGVSRVFKAKNSTSIHHKSAPYGSRGIIQAL